MAEPPDEPPPEEPAWLTNLASRVKPPDTPLVMQPGEAERAPPLPTYDTRQTGIAAAGQQMHDAGARQAPGQRISEETRQTFERVLGNASGKPKGPAPEETPPTPSGDLGRTPGD